MYAHNTSESYLSSGASIPVMGGNDGSIGEYVCLCDKGKSGY